LGKPVYDTGQTEFYRFAGKGFSSKRVAAYHEQVDRFAKQIETAAAQKRFDLIILDEWSRPPISMETLEKNYIQAERKMLGVGGSDFAMRILKPR
jgi:hypothetical protein